MKIGIPGLLAALALLGSLGAGDLIMEVDAGKHDRRDTPFSLNLPRDAAPAALEVTLEALDSKRFVPGYHQRGRLTWNLEAPLPAGSKRRYRLRTIPTGDLLHGLPRVVVKDVSAP